MKNPISAMLIVAVGIAVIVTLSFMQQKATAADLKSVIALADNNAGAVAVLRISLKETPTPTVWQLSRLKSAVEEELVLEQTRLVIGDESLRAQSVENVEAAAKDRDEIDAYLMKNGGLILLSCVGGIALAFVSYFMSQS